MSAVLALLLVLCNPSEASHKPERIAESIVLLQIKIPEINEPVILGSGALIKSDSSPTGWGILTAQHVAKSVQNTSFMEACFLDNVCVPVTSFTTGTESTADNTSNDWALMPVPFQKSRHWLKASKFIPELGDSVEAYGYPNAAFRYMPGHVASVYESGSYALALNMVISPGASGSPVIDSKGDIACIIVGYTSWMYPGIDPTIGLMLHRFDQTKCAIPRI